MTLIANICVGFIALLHLYILIMEVFLWTKPRTLKVFGMTKEEAEVSIKLASNMGLYNGFLSAGLIYGLITESMEFKLFFLTCICIAGIFGALTVSRKILIVQTVPALSTILMLVFL